MGLPLGLSVEETAREGFWKGDEAVDWDGTCAENQTLYMQTGEARHLTLKPNPARPPTRILFRGLRAREWLHVNEEVGKIDPADGMLRVRLLSRSLLCFAFGADLPDWPDQITDAKGKVVPKWSSESGLRRLSPDLIDRLHAGVGDEFFMFYGGLIAQASEATQADFFPSPQASTPRN